MTHDVIQESMEKIVVVLGNQFMYDGVRRVGILAGSTLVFARMNSEGFALIENDVTVDSRCGHCSFLVKARHSARRGIAKMLSVIGIVPTDDKTTRAERRFEGVPYARVAIG